MEESSANGKEVKEEGKRIRIVTTPSFDLYYPAQRVERQSDYVTRTSFSLEAPPRIPAVGDPKPMLEPPRSVGERRRGIQDQRSKTVTFTDGLAGVLEQRVRRLKRMPTPFWQRKEIKTDESREENKTFDDEEAESNTVVGVAAKPANKEKSLFSNFKIKSSGSSPSKSPSRTLSIKDNLSLDHTTTNKEDSTLKPIRKGSLPAAVVRRFTGDGILSLSAEHTVDHLA